MIVHPPPFQMKEQVFRGLGQGPGLTHQGSDTPADAQVDPFNEGSLNDRRKAMLLQKIIQVLTITPQHAHDGKGWLATLVTFDKLAVEQIVGNRPVVFSGTLGTGPLAKMGSDRIEITA